MDERYYKNTTFMQQLDVADVFVINKSDLASESEIQAVNDYFETHGFTSQSVIQVKQGEIPLSYLTVLPLVEQQADLNTKTPELLFSFVKNNNGASIRNDKSSSSDVRQEQFATHERLMHEDAEYISCGWVFQSGLLFNYDALLSFVPEIRSKQAFKDCMRLKGLLNTDKGMCEINTTNDVLSVQESVGETIKQPVIEVIFKQVSGQAAKESLSVFETQLLACLIA